MNKNQDKATKPQTVQIVRQGEATPYWFLLIHDITNNAKTSAKPQQRLTCQETRFTCGFALKNKQAA
ncbi:transposase [Neisseria meningitidis]|nr:transposase [Neisseria meningitidis]